MQHEAWEAGFSPLRPPGQLPPPAQETIAKVFSERLAQPSVRGIVAERDGDVVGSVMFGLNRDLEPIPGAGELRTLYVAPDSWGQGVGRALVDACMQGLAELGYTHASVWSFEDNDRANALYERTGFRRDGARKTPENYAGLDVIRLTRALERR